MLFPRYISELLGIAKAVKSVNLKAARRIQAEFDPFHSQVESIRDFMFHTSASKIRQTNPKCSFKATVLDDRSDPVVKVTLANKQEIVFKTANLSCVEILKLFNTHVSDLAPKESEEPAPPTSAAAGVELKSQSKKNRKRLNFV